MLQPMNTSSANHITLENSPVSEENKNSSQDSVLWTTKEVAKHLHVSLKTVFNLRKRGLPFVQLGGAVRFVPQEIRDYLVNSRGLSSHRLRQIVRKGAAI
jgi:excisionase family DNA binding protein